MSGKHYDKDAPTHRHSEEMSQETKNALDYPGVATDIADGDVTTPEMVKQSTKELNNNPRNTDGPKLK